MPWSGLRLFPPGPLTFPFKRTHPFCRCHSTKIQMVNNSYRNWPLVSAPGCPRRAPVSGLKSPIKFKDHFWASRLQEVNRTPCISWAHLLFKAVDYEHGILGTKSASLICCQSAGDDHGAFKVAKARRSIKPRSGKGGGNVAPRFTILNSTLRSCWNLSTTDGKLGAHNAQARITRSSGITVELKVSYALTRNFFPYEAKFQGKSQPAFPPQAAPASAVKILIFPERLFHLFFIVVVRVEGPKMRPQSMTSLDALEQNLLCSLAPSTLVLLRL